MVASLSTRESVATAEAPRGSDDVGASAWAGPVPRATTSNTLSNPALVLKPLMSAPSVAPVSRACGNKAKRARSQIFCIGITCFWPLEAVTPSAFFGRPLGKTPVTSPSGPRCAQPGHPSAPETGPPPTTTPPHQAPARPHGRAQGPVLVPHPERVNPLTRGG